MYLEDSRTGRENSRLNTASILNKEGHERKEWEESERGRGETDR